MKVWCNWEKRHNIVPYTVAKHFAGVEIEQGEKDTGYGSTVTVQEFMAQIPGWDYREKMQYIEKWKVGMKYAEVLEAVKAMEETMEETEKTEGKRMDKKEEALAWALLYSEGVFVNVHKSGKIKAYRRVDELYTRVSKQEEETVKEYERMQRGDTKKKDEGCYEIGLAEGQRVVTRFPPEPNGYMHIGHAKAALLNQYFAQKHNGEMIVRMDDTNPTNEREEYEETIMEDIKMLGIDKYKKTRTSEHFDKLIELAVVLIQKGLAYCDRTPVEEMREKRDKGIATEDRENTVEKNMRIFSAMQQGEEYDMYCVRAKISVEDTNKAMRDPVIYRVNKTPHHYTGTKYRVYPTYDFACPVVDSIEGVTLALRTNEYRDRNPQYAWFIDALQLENKPQIWDFGRLNFKRTVLSKRKLRWFVEHKKVTGWDDPRMPTVRGILRKGLSKEALRQYIIMQGPSRHTVLLSWDKIWAINAKAIDSKAKRIHGIAKADAVVMRLEDETGKSMQRERIVKAEGKEDRVITNEVYVSQKDTKDVCVGDEIMLMGAESYRIVETSPLRGVQTKTEAKNTKIRVTWIPVTKAQTVMTVEYGDLITVDKPDEQEASELFNTESKKEEEAWCDERVLSTKQGEYVQIEKRGFYICDSTDPRVLNLVPGTKQDRK